jgi:hypothetical protein
MRRHKFLALRKLLYLISNSAEEGIENSYKPGPYASILKKNGDWLPFNRAGSMT